MKYRVVGWTDYESDEIPEAHGCIGFAERNAIIDEIRKSGPPSFWMISTRFGTLMPGIRSHFGVGIGLQIL